MRIPVISPTHLITVRHYGFIRCLLSPDNFFFVLFSGYGTNYNESRTGWKKIIIIAESRFAVTTRRNLAVNKMSFSRVFFFISPRVIIPLQNYYYRSARGGKYAEAPPEHRGVTSRRKRDVREYDFSFNRQNIIIIYSLSCTGFFFFFFFLSILRRQLRISTHVVISLHSYNNNIRILSHRL